MFDQIYAVLRRACPIDITPECDLILNILSMGLLDVQRKREHRHVKAWFWSAPFRAYCKLVCLNPEWVRHTFSNAGIPMVKPWISQRG